MSENRDWDARSWDDEEADGERAIAEMRASINRLRGQVGTYRQRVGDNDNAESSEA